MEFFKKNFTILLAFILPMALIVVVALSVYLPSLFLSTNYNFIYAICVDKNNEYSYNCENYLQKRYVLVNNKITIQDVVSVPDLGNNKIPDTHEKYIARIFLHDTAKNESREITPEEAQTLNLSGLLTSPDGVTISSSYTNGDGLFFIFGGNSSSYGYDLTKGKSRNKLNLINSLDQYYYRNNFHFIGWVLPGRN